jgi:tripeptidyl-peptidase-1
VVFPGFLRWLYGTGEYVPSATDQNKLAVVGMEDQFPSRQDLTTFMNHFAGHPQAATFAAVQVNNGVNDPNDPGEQANLETQYAAAMAFPTLLVFYSVGGEIRWDFADGMPIAGDAFLEWFNHILEEQNIPQTISMTYGTNELTLPAEYAATICDLFLRLGAQGVSVLVGSGDFGVGEGNCRGADGQGPVRFIPDFPSSCTCGLLSPLPNTRQARVQVAHQTAMVSQVHGSLASAALASARLGTTQRSQRACPEAASRPTFGSRSTSSMR